MRTLIAVTGITLGIILTRAYDRSRQAQNLVNRFWTRN